MRVSIAGSVLIAALAATACQEAPTSPRALSVITSLAADRSTGDTPNYNLEVLLRPVGSGDGFGHVKFREPQNDDFDRRVLLDVWVRDLAPNTEYLLQRGVDSNLDGNCTGAFSVTVGRGLTPQSILTDEKGTGREDLFRNLMTAGATFDIHFRVIRKIPPMTVVLQSECYQFTVR